MNIKPYRLIKKSLTDSYKKDLIRLSETLFKMSEFVKNRQVVDNAIVTRYDINHLNKILKINLDYEKVTSVAYIIPNKKKAERVAKALFILSELIKNNEYADEEESTLFRSLVNVDIDIFKISLSFTDFRKTNFVLYEEISKLNYMTSVQNWGDIRRYYMSYQYDEMSKSEERRYNSIVKKMRQEAAKKAAITRRKNKLEAERKEKERIEWEQKQLASTADKVEQFKQQINDYIESNPDMTLYIDTETSSLEHDKKVLEIAIVDEDENIILHTLCNYFDIKIDSNSKKIHGISEDDLEKNGIRLLHLESELQRLFKDRTLAFYNATFDITAIKNSLTKNFEFEPSERIDVMRGFAPIYGEYVDWAESYRWQKLTTACQYYDIEYNNAHNALADAIATARVHKKMNER